MEAIQYLPMKPLRWDSSPRGRYSRYFNLDWTAPVTWWRYILCGGKRNSSLRNKKWRHHALLVWNRLLAGMDSYKWPRSANVRVLPSYFPSILSTFPIHESWEPLTMWKWLLLSAWTESVLSAYRSREICVLRISHALLHLFLLGNRHSLFTVV